jgi:hypothetical protein
MTKEEALYKTISRFTNLLDRKVLPNVAVKTIINYYEGLLKNEHIEVKTTSNIVQNFVEQDIDFMTDSDF